MIMDDRITNKNNRFGYQTFNKDSLQSNLPEKHVGWTQFGGPPICDDVEQGFVAENVVGAQQSLVLVVADNQWNLENDLVHYFIAFSIANVMSFYNSKFQ
jgi:hypothetical protein